MTPHMINRLLSSTFTPEQTSNLKFERNNNLTFVVIIIYIDRYEQCYLITFSAVSPRPTSTMPRHIQTCRPGPVIFPCELTQTSLDANLVLRNSCKPRITSHILSQLFLFLGQSDACFIDCAEDTGLIISDALHLLSTSSTSLLVTKTQNEPFEYGLRQHFFHF